MGIRDISWDVFLPFEWYCLASQTLIKVIRNYFNLAVSIMFIGVFHHQVPGHLQTLWQPGSGWQLYRIGWYHKIYLSHTEHDGYNQDRGLIESLQRRHNGRNGVSNHRRLDCLPNGLFRRTSKKTSRLRVTGLCEWNPPETGGFHS